MQIQEYQKQALATLKQELKTEIVEKGDANWLAKIIEVESADQVRDLAFQLKGEIKNLVLLVGAKINGKANLTILFGQELVDSFDLNAGTIIREVAKEIQGGGGGQPFFASAGGKNPEGLQKALAKAEELIEAQIKK